MKKRPSTTLMAIGGLGAFALVVALAGFVIAVMPQLSKAGTLDDQIASAQLQLAGLHGGPAKKPDIKAAELFQLSRAMPDQPDMPGLLLELSRLADTSSVELAGLQPGAAAQLTDGAMALPLQLTVQGSWTNVTKFLRNLRANVRTHAGRLTVAGRLFDVDSVQITPVASGPASDIQAVLAVNAFQYSVAPPPPPVTSTTTTSTTTTTSSSSTDQQAAGSTGGGS
jgi:Tfp pilus assembly protein PilO